MPVNVEACERVFRVGRPIEVPRTSYIESYPHLLAYFASVQTLAREHIVCGSHMAYGWMPTILELRPTTVCWGQSVDRIAGLLNDGRHRLLDESEMRFISSVVNNSVVGTSKLLHFVSPSRYPIWDRIIYRFIHRRQPHDYQVNNTRHYMCYIESLTTLLTHPHFDALHGEVNQTLGYDVSGLRALELVMYLNAPPAPRGRRPR